MHTDHIAQDMKLLHLKGKLNELYDNTHKAGSLTRKQLVSIVTMVHIRVDMMLEVIDT